MQEKESSIQRLFNVAQRYLKLKTEDVKLSLSEKITILVSTFAVAAAILLLSATTLLFLSMACAHWIAESTGLSWAYLIVAGVYLVLMVLAVVFRRQIIIDPVARFVTRIILS